MSRVLHAAIVLALGVGACGHRVEGPAGPAGVQGPAGPPGADDPHAARDGSRLKRVHVVDNASDGAMKRTGWWWKDTARNETCSSSAASDGTTRCLPTMIDSFAAFSDPSCSTPVRAARDDFDALPCTLYANVSDDLASSRPAPITGSRQAPVWTRDASGTGACSQFDATVATYVLTLGDEVPPDAFVRMQNVEEIEP